jgi:hypothetical protein
MRHFKFSYEPNLNLSKLAAINTLPSTVWASELRLIQIFTIKTKTSFPASTCTHPKNTTFQCPSEKDKTIPTERNWNHKHQQPTKKRKKQIKKGTEPLTTLGAQGLTRAGL